MAARRSDPAAIAAGVEQVLAAWRHLAHVVRLRERLAERESGLSGAQLFALRQLATGPGVSLGELAARTATHASSISVVVTRLIEKGLVQRERDPGDARRALLHPTDEGLARLERSPESPDVLLLGALTELAPDERRQLATWLASLADAVASPSATSAVPA